MKKGSVSLATIPEENKEGTQEDLEMAELQDILDDPDDTEYPVRMTDQKELMEIFTILETKNLFLIQQVQEND